MSGEWCKGENDGEALVCTYLASREGESNHTILSIRGADTG